MLLWIFVRVSTANETSHRQSQNFLVGISFWYENFWTKQSEKNLKKRIQIRIYWMLHDFVRKKRMKGKRFKEQLNLDI